MTEFPVTVVDACPHGQGAAEQAARSDHREGWEYFLARLGQLLAPPQPE